MAANASISADRILPVTHVLFPCAIATATSPNLTSQERTPVPAKAPMSPVSTRRGRLRGCMWIPVSVTHGFVRAADGTITNF